jgi:tetratricopeptide (TPR) repeat protein
LARDATSDDERFTLLCEAGEIWARRAEELDKAALVFEEARSIRPLDHWLLHTLMWLYGERHRWAELAHVLGDIAQIQESPARKAKSVFALAQVVLEKVNDPRRAVEHFDEVLDLDTSRLDAFEQIVRILTERKDWPSLERAYRKMIARLRATANAQHAALEFALFHQLGLIYRDRLEDAASAVDALTFAAKLRPDDVEVRKMVTELLVVTDNLDNAITRTREHVNNTPFDPEVYAELYDLFLRQRAFDEAWCVADVLVQMRPLTAEQLRFHDEYGPGYTGASRPRASGVLSASAWSQHVLHADLDRTLTTLLASLTPAVARLRQNQVHPDTIKRFSALDSALFETIRTTFQDAASVLQMSAPELLVGDARASVPFVAAFVPFGALYVNAKAIDARADTLPYIVGKRMAERSPELAARTFFPVVSDLATLLGIAIRIGRQQSQAEIGATTFETALSSILTQGERETVRAIVRKATLEAGMADVKRWADAADLSSTRVGLLLCGSVGIARKAILAEPLLPSDLAPREKTSALYKFAISDHYFALRRAIGVAVDA